LAKCAATTLSSKLIGGEKEFFASMVVDAVIAIGNDDRLNMIGIKKVNLLGNAFVFFLPMFFCLILHVIL
jgi:chaperonin GroEL (HSP60 family)